MYPRRVPRATYRLQLHRAFDFDAAGRVAPYLSALGVSHAYSSPQLQATPGSQHGYDVVDHRSVSSDLGGEAGRRRFVATLESNGLSQVLDIVPNHVAIGSPLNRWWWSLLREGPESTTAAAFDLDLGGGPGRPEERDGTGDRREPLIRLPVLGDHYGRVLRRGELELDIARGGGEGGDGGDRGEVVRYGDHVFPLASGSLATATGVRDRELALAQANASIDVLDAVLAAQHYQLTYWRVAAEDLDYRRFFDVTDLVGIRVEDPLVFDATHDLILEWVAEGSVEGLRVDHPDGLRDPGNYFERLRSRAPDTWLVVEKILEPGEAIPPWPVDGTTGYDALRDIGALFIDPAGVAGLEGSRAPPDRRGDRLRRNRRRGQARCPGEPPRRRGSPPQPRCSPTRPGVIETSVTTRAPNCAPL